MEVLERNAISGKAEKELYNYAESF
jgi:hypothetical protein